MALIKLSLAALSTLAAYGLFKLLRVVVRPLSSPLRVLPGPASSSLIFGNMGEIRRADTSSQHEAWIQQYGKVMQYKAFLGVSALCMNDAVAECKPDLPQEYRLFTMDAKAINHIFTHSMDYQKPEQARFNLARLLGAGTTLSLTSFLTWLMWVYRHTDY